MRPASTRLFAGTTTRSRLPHTMRVGALIPPRNGMLDQLETASVCHNMPRGLGRGQGLSSTCLRRLRMTARLLLGVDPRPHEVETRTKERTLAGTS
jgi:hypothetical protein